MARGIVIILMVRVLPSEKLKDLEIKRKQRWILPTCVVRIIEEHAFVAGGDLRALRALVSNRVRLPCDFKLETMLDLTYH